MNVYVRVVSGPALAQMKMLEAQTRRTAQAGSGLGKQLGSMPGLSRFGNQVQWVGRQLMYNFTLPIALAMGAATKFALENEKSMVRVEKVYGDAGKVWDRLAQQELPALREAFVALSNQFGVHQQQVIDIAGDWAAAGASGVALAKSVKLTLETMVLGELEAVDATKQLIAIQAQYGLGITDLTKTIDVLNMVENQTGATMKDLMMGFQRAAGVARVAGVDVRHLGAMIAALVPASGSAATAGNALKTIISRILSPTTDAKDLLRETGIAIDGVAWNSLNGTQRLEALAEKFDSLSMAQKAHMSTVLGSRWQLNRLNILLGDMVNQNGYYTKALKATADPQRIFKQRQEEIMAVLKSSPQRMQQAWVVIKNAMSEVILPLLPYIVYLASQIARMAQSFADLSIGTQKWILAGLVFLAIIGPIARYVGAISSLFGVLRATLYGAAGAFLALGKTLASPLVGLAKLAFFPFKMVAAGFLLLGKAALLGMAKVKGAILGTALISHLAGIVTLFKTTVVSALVTAWSLLVLRLGIIWRAFAAQMAVFMAVFARKMMVVWTAMMSGLRVITGAGLVAIRALFVWLHSSLLTATFVLRATLAAAWVTVMAGIQRVVLAGSMALTALWTLLHRTMIAVTTAAGAALRTAWLLILGSGRAFVAGIAVISTSALTLVKAMAMGLVAFALKIPAMMLKLVPLLFRALVSPWGLAIAAALGLLYAFRDKIAQTWTRIVQTFRNAMESTTGIFASVVGFFDSVAQRIIDAFWALPVGVQNAMIAVLTVVKNVAVKIYEWMSYLNPFVRHSPSLVESVKKGMNAIIAYYAKAAGVGGAFKKAAADLAAFKRIAGQLQQFEWGDETKDIGKAFPKALPLFRSMLGNVNNLNRVLDRMGAGIARQEGVVDRWAKKLERANNVLDRQRAKLERLQARLETLQAAYDKHADKLQFYADAPIKGMGAMEDAIFDNEMAQKKLRLEMIKFEETNGSVDSLRDRFAMLQGDIEKMRGRLNDLRAGGAGSEILGPIEAQIAAMEAQARSMQGAQAPLEKMQSELEKLQREGEILDLEKSIKFDPMVREIDKLVNAREELDFNRIINGIKTEQAAMAALEPKIANVTQQIEKQEQAVKAAEAARDRVQASYDREAEKLQMMEEAYGKVESAIRDLESAMRDMGQAASQELARLKEIKDKKKAAEDAKKKAKGADSPAVGTAVETFRNAKLGDWPDVGGRAKIGREGGMGSQKDLIEQFTQDSIDEMNSIFGSFNMFEPLQKWWSKTWNWIKEHVGPVIQAVGDGLKQAWDAIPNPFSGGKFTQAFSTFRNIWDTLADIVRSAWGAVKAVIDLFAPDVKRVWDALVEGGKKVWNQLGPELAKFGKLWGPLGEAIKNLWEIIKPGIAIIGVLLVGAFKILASVFSHTIGPVIDFAIGVLENFIRIIRGVAEVIIGVLAGDWELAWQGIKDIFWGVWNGIINYFTGVVGVIIGIVKGIVVGIWEFFVWLYDILIGNSVVPDIVNGIVEVFGTLITLATWIWDHVLKPIVDFFVDAFEDIVGGLTGWWAGITKAWSNITSGKWWSENVWQPISKGISDWWDERLEVWASWWEAIKGAWSNIRENIKNWWLNNIWNPVKNGITDWWAERLVVWASWWEAIKGAWSNIKDNIKNWWLTNVWNPVKNGITGWWTERLEVWAGWWGDIKKAWDNIKSGDWWEKNVMDPIANAITGAWKGIKDWFSKNSDTVLDPIRSVVRKIVDAINWVIKGINKLSELPGLDFYINPIVLPGNFAKGGELPATRRVGGGFKTSGARAIVGEGKANYPEYVIPTDPTYRSRAQALLQQAASKVGMYGIPMHAEGGILGTLKNVVGNAVNAGKTGFDWIAGNISKLASQLAMPLVNKAKSIINEKVDWKYGRMAVNAAIDKVVGWIDIADKFYEDKAKSFVSPGGPPIQAGDWERVSFRGHQFNARTVRMILAAEKILGQQYHITQGSWSNYSASAGTHSGGGAFDATSPATIAAQNAARQVGFAAWLRSPSQGDWPWHIHAIALGDIQASSAAKAQMQSYLAGGDGLAGGMAKGGIVRARVGGVTKRLAEAGQDEAVIPLPRNWRRDIFGNDKKSEGTTVIQIHGNLEFPNIKTGEDAEVFIANLKSLAGGAA